MSKVEAAVDWMVHIAYDDSYGYDQNNRWGPNYDCSSLVIQGYENAGTGVKSAGATYTGNMYFTFTRCGFIDVTDKVNLSNGNGLQYGDVLLNDEHHTAVYIGNNQIVHASINEKGKARGGQSGDQTGREICVRSYYNYPWNHVLRLNEEGMTSPQSNPEDIDWEALRRYCIAMGQKALNDFVGHNLIRVDGVVGPNTRRMKIRALQHALNLDYNADLKEDGLYGSKTEKALGTHFVRYGETQYLVTFIEIMVWVSGGNPNGVEKPGIYGDGLKRALHGVDYCDANFIKFCALW